MIQTLDLRKNEAIESTFSTVALYFDEIFQKLVPAGKGALVIDRKYSERNEEENSANIQSSTNASADSYSGVGIKVLIV